MSLVARGDWLSGLSLDDQLWHQSLIAYRRHQEVKWATGARASPDWAGVQQTDDDQVLLKLLGRGITNQSAFDRLFNASTRSMRFATVMGDHLWSLLERERLRVRNHLTFVVECQVTNPLSRAIILSVKCMTFASSLMNLWTWT